MQKFELLSIKCKMCDWRWEITPREKTENLCCNHCGSKNLDIEKQDLHMFKKSGKFITDIGFSHPRDTFGLVPVEDIMGQNKEPILVVNEKDIKISKDMTNEELKNLLSKINSIRNRIIDEVQVNHEELINKLTE